MPYWSTKHWACTVKASMVSWDHQGTALPLPSYCLPWSSKPWVISCPMTMPMHSGLSPLCHGAVVEVARHAAREERALQDAGRERDGVVVGGVPGVHYGGVHQPHVPPRLRTQLSQVLTCRPVGLLHHVLEVGLGVRLVGSIVV